MKRRCLTLSTHKDIPYDVVWNVLSHYVGNDIFGLCLGSEYMLSLATEVIGPSVKGRCVDCAVHHDYAIGLHWLETQGVELFKGNALTLTIGGTRVDCLRWLLSPSRIIDTMAFDVRQVIKSGSRMAI